MNYFNEVLVPQGINNTAVLCKVTHFIVKQTRLCVKADGNCFEQFILHKMYNGIILTFSL
jgi:hypothetical protein